MAGFLSDVPGLSVGHASLGDTGVSVVTGAGEGVQAGLVAAVDVRGGGPGTRETDLLEPHNTVQRIHAITLTGGSAFGLAAADGVMTALESHGVGFPVFGENKPDPRVPIVPAAVIFDLAVGSAEHRPGPADGAAALEDALNSAGATPPTGSVGAGCGATAGRLRGGWGEASATVQTSNGEDWIVAAGVVANPVGEVIDPDTGKLYGDAAKEGVDKEKFAAEQSAYAKLNTTIGVVATSAPVSKAQAKRLAMVGHDGIARAIRPAHSPLDGDTLFAVSPGDGSGVSDEVMVALSAAAANVVQAAIVTAVTTAESGYGMKSWREINKGA